MTTTVLSALLLFTNGCTAPQSISIPYLGKYHKSPRIIIKKKYIKVTPRKLLNLPAIGSCEITDYHRLDAKYFAVNVIQWAKCTRIAQKKDRRLNFYETQNKGYK